MAWPGRSGRSDGGAATAIPAVILSEAKDPRIDATFSSFSPGILRRCAPQDDSQTRKRGTTAQYGLFASTSTSTVSTLPLRCTCSHPL